MFMSEGFKKPTREELRECLASTGPAPFQEIPNFDALLQFEGACEAYQNTALPFCEDLKAGNQDEQNTGLCACDAYNALVKDDNSNLYAFAYDSALTVAEGLRLLQENCTALNELNEFRGRGIDFCAETFTPSALTAAIGAVNFTGRTGQISFVNGTFVRKTAYFDFFQWNADLTSTKVGQFLNDEVFVNFSAFIFPDKEIPTSGKQQFLEKTHLTKNFLLFFQAIIPEVPDLSDAYAAVFFGLIVFLTVMDLLCIGWLALKWKVKPVRRSSPLFLMITAVGVLLVLIAGIVNCNGLSSSAMCALYAFFLLTGMTLLLASILAKTWRIHRIFTYKSPDALTIADKNLVFLPLGLMLLTWALYFVYAFAGGTIEATLNVSNDNLFYAYKICESPTEWLQVFTIILFYVYFFILIAMIGILSYLTRSISIHYNESKNLATVVYIYLCFGIIFIPLFYTQGDYTNSQAFRFTIVSVAVIILMFATMALLFLPLFLKTRRFEKRHQ